MPEFSTDKLWRTLVLLDRRTLPVTMSYWDEPTQAFVAIGGPTGATGPAGPPGSGGSRGGALARSTGQSNLLDWGYLATMDGLAVLTDSAEPIATQWPCVAAQPELVVTAAGDIIRC